MIEVDQDDYLFDEEDDDIVKLTDDEFFDYLQIENEKEKIQKQIKRIIKERNSKNIKW